VNVQSRHSTKDLYIKISNRKKLQLQALVDSGYIHTKINKQLVKKEKIKIEPIDRSFKMFMQIAPRMEKLYDMYY